MPAPDYRPRGDTPIYDELIAGPHGDPFLTDAERDHLNAPVDGQLPLEEPRTEAVSTS